MDKERSFFFEKGNIEKAHACAKNLLGNIKVVFLVGVINAPRMLGRSTFVAIKRASGARKAIGRIPFLGSVSSAQTASTLLAKAGMYNKICQRRRHAKALA